MTRKRRVDDIDYKMKGKRGYAAHSESDAAVRTRVARLKVRKYLKEHKQPCLFCGCEDDIEYHHFNTTIKPRNMMQIKSIKTAKEELDRCWQLCQVCHFKLHLGSVCPLPSCY